MCLHIIGNIWNAIQIRKNLFYGVYAKLCLFHSSNTISLWQITLLSWKEIKVTFFQFFFFKSNLMINQEPEFTILILMNNIITKIAQNSEGLLVTSSTSCLYEFSVSGSVLHGVRACTGCLQCSTLFLWIKIYWVVLFQ